MPDLDDEDPAPSASTSLSDLISPGRPVTFVAGGCQITVGRDTSTFAIALAGVLNSNNRRAVGEVLEVLVANAEAMHVSLRQLSELDVAGTALLIGVAEIASRSHVIWLVVDGCLMWEAALDRLASNTALSPCISVRPQPGLAPRLRRRRPRIVPTT